MMIPLFRVQIVWRDHHQNRFSETIPMSGHTIGFGREMEKKYEEKNCKICLAFKTGALQTPGAKCNKTIPGVIGWQLCFNPDGTCDC